MQLHVTENAIKKIKALAEAKAMASFYLRIGLRAGGCMGLEQYFELQAEKREDDVEVLVDTVSFILDPKSAKLLEGMKLDWKETLMEKRFDVSFPLKRTSCSCGSSFSV